MLGGAPAPPFSEQTILELAEGSTPECNGYAVLRPVKCGGPGGCVPRAEPGIFERENPPLWDDFRGFKYGVPT